MVTAYGLLADAIDRQLDAGIGDLTRAAGYLLSDVGSMEQRSPLDGRDMLRFGPLASLGGVTREAVYDRLERLRNVRQEAVKAHQWPAQPSPESVLRAARSVLLAADAAAGVERFYADAERAARVGAAIAELRGDERGMATYRGALIGATKDALTALDHGTAVAPSGDGMLSALELMRAELVARLRGEVQTTGREVEELAAVTRFLVDVDVEIPGACSYGPLCWDGTRLEIGASGVMSRSGKLRSVRRTITDPGPTTPPRRWPRTTEEIGARLGTLLLVVVSADATASIDGDYAEAEARATAEAAAVHHLQCGGFHGFCSDGRRLAPCDEPGVAAQREGLWSAAKAAAERLQSVTCGPFSTEQDIKGVLLDQLAS